MARFMHELRALKDEINNTQSDEMVVSVIKDFLDQISNLRRRKKLNNIFMHTLNLIFINEDWNTNDIYIRIMNDGTIVLTHVR